MELKFKMQIIEILLSYGRMCAQKRHTGCKLAVLPTRPLARALLQWFDRQARPLPWRRTTDPYAIWISEVMLQQTQVATVIPYWERWLRELPTVADLAAAVEEKVLKLWEGLGYYRRARCLRTAAQLVMERHEGRIPQQLPELLALPGIGRYTAGAVLSIAFNEPAPILDGNVERVLCRFHGIRKNPQQSQTRQQLWSLAADWVQLAAELEKKQPDHFGRACSHFNQALMELGAMVCLPARPECGLCPWRGHCYAYQHQLVEQLPNRPRHPTLNHRLLLAAVVTSDHKVLVRQRPAHVVNGGLWEFPNVEIPVGKGAKQGRAGESRRLATWLRREFKLQARHFTVGAVLKHTITRNRYDVRVWHARATPSPTPISGIQWVAASDLERLPMPAAHRRIAQMWAENLPSSCHLNGARGKTCREP